MQSILVKHSESKKRLLPAIRFTKEIENIEEIENREKKVIAVYEGNKFTLSYAERC